MRTKPKLETLVIELTPATVKLWEIDDDDKCSSLQNELERNEELISFINRYQIDRWVVYSIDEISVTHHEENEGEIDIQYTRHEYNGCKDLNGEDDDYLNVSFSINFERLQIVITGESVQEGRSTLDEF